MIGLQLYVSGRKKLSFWTRYLFRIVTVDSRTTRVIFSCIREIYILEGSIYIDNPETPHSFRAGCAVSCML